MKAKVITARKRFKRKNWPIRIIPRQ